MAEYAATALYSFLNLEVLAIRIASEVFNLRMNYDILFR